MKLIRLLIFTSIFSTSIFSVEASREFKGFLYLVSSRAERAGIKKGDICTLRTSSNRDGSINAILSIVNRPIPITFSAAQMSRRNSPARASWGKMFIQHNPRTTESITTRFVVEAADADRDNNIRAHVHIQDGGSFDIFSFYCKLPQ